MSIVRGPVETYRGTSEGFLGSEGSSGGGSGVTGAFGNASNFVAVTVNNGSVTAATTFPRAVGSTGVVGDANNYPVLTLTNGEVTATSTAPRQVATGVVAGSYGSAFATPSFVVDAFGALTSASSLTTRLPAVLWSAVDSTAFGAGANLTYSAVVFNSSNCISQVVAGTSMTVSATGLYLAFAYNIITAITASALRFQVNGVTTIAGCASANVTQSAVGLLSLTAGDVVTTGFSLAVTTAASTRYFGLVKVS